MIHSIRLSHVELLELSQLADFFWQRRELVGADLKARDTSQTEIDEPRVPHVEPLEIGQQTKLGRKRSELVVEDLKQHGFRSDHDPIASTISHRASRAWSGARFRSAASKACCRRGRASLSSSCGTTRTAPPSYPCYKAGDKKGVRAKRRANHRLT